jgi:nitrogen regulatory protein PII
MTSMKKVEIVVDALEVPAVAEVLDASRVSGYTVIGEVTGRGSRGVRGGGDGLTAALKNSYIITACPETQARAIADAVRPILRRVGGICVVTDCLWVEH